VQARLSRITTFGLLQWLTLLLGLALGVVLLLIAGEHPEGPVPSILREAGIVTLGTVAVSLVYDIVLRPAQVKQIQATIQDSLIVNARDYGLTRIARLDFVGLFERLKEGDELWWLDTYCPDMDKEGVRDAMKRALTLGATLRMLVIDPDSEIAKARAEEIRIGGFDPISFQAGARRHLGFINGLKGELLPGEAERLHVETYAGLPCAPIYLRMRGREDAGDWTTGQALEGWTSYFLRWPTYEAAHLHWGRPVEDRPPPLPGLGLDAFSRYFGDKWEREEKRKSSGRGAAGSRGDVNAGEVTLQGD
jgi:hypothetical protein